ncbi:MAG TPA: AtpZ/AtpI family protein [Myxococcota bacterium]|nr:AtpZ/AtpI family protein [Myxococcota bacterium]
MSRYARREPSGATFWRSLSLLGTVGWSISIPAVLGAWLGHRLDVRFETGVHFTLILLTLGVIIGSVVVWRVLRSHQE